MRRYQTPTSEDIIAKRNTKLRRNVTYGIAKSMRTASIQPVVKQCQDGLQLEQSSCYYFLLLHLRRRKVPSIFHTYGLYNEKSVMLQEPAATAGETHLHDFPMAFSTLVRPFRLALSVMFGALYRDGAGYTTSRKFTFVVIWLRYSLSSKSVCPSFLLWKQCMIRERRENKEKLKRRMSKLEKGRR